jgi:glycosyltransferase involved in cell wall biosynthesis
MFEKRGWDAQFIDYRDYSEEHLIGLASSVDVVYLLKVASLSLVQKLKSGTKAKIVFDLADALWKPIHRQAGWQDLEAILTTVDCIFTENEFIDEYGKRFNRTIYVPIVTNVNKFDEARRQFPRNKNKALRVGWLGSAGTAIALTNISSLIVPVFRRHPELELRVVGCKNAELLSGYAGLNMTIVTEYDEPRMFEEIVQFDIGLFPPPSDLEDYRMRGAQKAMFYMQAAVPPIALNIGDCARIIEDGVTGMLVNEPSDWANKLEELINYPEKRISMGELASQKIRIGHSHEEVFNQLEAALITVMRGKEAIKYN